MLRIAQLAPPFLPVPPPQYGGTERVVALLTEELVRRGHRVTLFASGDSQTTARLVPTVPTAVWAQPDQPPAVALALALGACYGQAAEFDVIHSHVDLAAFPVARVSPTPTLHTLHGRLDLPALAPVYAAYPDIALVSISASQRRPLPQANWLATVYNAVDLPRLPFNPHGGRHLVFLGRISPEKGVDRAIRIARRAGAELVIAAREPLPATDDANNRLDWEYYQMCIKPLLTEPGIHFVGEVGPTAKARLLGEALALLNPVDWEEPFGLVMAEALACGTPVLATPRGSVPELIEQGVTGYLGDEATLAAAVAQVGSLDRRHCRAVAEARFSPARMADGYEAAYAQLLNGADPRRSTAPTSIQAYQSPHGGPSSPAPIRILRRRCEP